jgi:hypothetical protein
MKLNSEVIEGMRRMELFDNRRVTDLQKEESGVIKEMGFSDGAEPYVSVKFDNGELKTYTSKEFGNLYVADDKAKPKPKE